MNRLKSVFSSQVKSLSGFVTIASILSNLEKLVIKISTVFLQMKYTMSIQ